MTRRTRVALAAVMLPAAVIVGVSTFFYKPFGSPTQRAYRLCAECSDLSRDEVDWLIDANKHSTLTREQSLELFRGQFDDPADAEHCEPCTTAILDAADRMNQP